MALFKPTFSKFNLQLELNCKNRLEYALLKIGNNRKTQKVRQGIHYRSISNQTDS